MAETVTVLLQQWKEGDDKAREALWPVVYGELRRLAGGYLKSQSVGHTLQPTALVHEAYVRLVGTEPSGQTRAEFFALAATAMRSVLIDHARAKSRKKRGGDELRVTLNEAIQDDDLAATQTFVDLDRAITSLSKLDERKAKVVEYFYFGGLTQVEIAQMLDVSESTVRGDLRFSKAWLKKELKR